MIRQVIIAVIIALVVVLSKAQVIGHNSTLTKNGQDVVLRCEVEGLTSYKPVSWYKGDVKIVPTDKFALSDVNDTLSINKAIMEDVGEYTCGFTLDNGDSYNQSIHLFAFPHVSDFDSHSKNLVQGDPLVLSCNAWGHPLPVVHWLKDNEPITGEKDPRVSIVNHGKLVNGTLRIEDLDYPDRADYTCIATYNEHQMNTTILVRVKDKLAALWPFLGICAEVIILCAIIFIYEKRRSKKMEDEAEPTEEQGHLTNSNDHKGKDDIRQRK
jgi:hypothetical protein